LSITGGAGILEYRRGIDWFVFLTVGRECILVLLARASTDGCTTLPALDVAGVVAAAAAGDFNNSSSSSRIGDFKHSSSSSSTSSSFSSRIVAAIAFLVEDDEEVR
jgi:hypothetical protein